MSLSARCLATAGPGPVSGESSSRSPLRLCQPFVVAKFLTVLANEAAWPKAKVSGTSGSSVSVAHAPENRRFRCPEHLWPVRNVRIGTPPVRAAVVEKLDSAQICADALLGSPLAPRRPHVHYLGRMRSSRNSNRKIGGPGNFVFLESCVER